MWFGRCGGVLTIASGVLFVVSRAAGLAGGVVFVGGTSVGSVVLTASLAVGAIGVGIISIVGPASLDGRALRLALGTMAVGLACVAASGIYAAGSTIDPPKGLILALSGFGGLTMVVGGIAGCVYLVRMAGFARVVGYLALIGIVLRILTPVSDASGVAGVWRVLSVSGDLAFALVGVGIGILAIRDHFSESVVVP